ncbi:MAG: hypothetical protein KDE14_16630, partial [Rhodobacteraceae bacterium]|nr:hypothetical protein [Paracoccaceae bacterium]
KYQVQGLEDQLHAKQEQVDRAQTAIRVLEAEWAYLNDPIRLNRLSGEYLGFVSPAQANIVTLSDIPFRDGALPALSPPATHQSPAPQFPIARDSGDSQFASNERTAPIVKQTTAAYPTAVRADQTMRAATQRPSALPALVARLQRIFVPARTGAAIATEASP